MPPLVPVVQVPAISESDAATLPSLRFPTQPLFDEDDAELEKEIESALEQGLDTPDEASAGTDPQTFGLGVNLQPADATIPLDSSSPSDHAALGTTELPVGSVGTSPSPPTATQNHGQSPPPPSPSATSHPAKRLCTGYSEVPTAQLLNEFSLTHNTSRGSNSLGTCEGRGRTALPSDSDIVGRGHQPSTDPGSNHILL